MNLRLCRALCLTAIIQFLYIPTLFGQEPVLFAGHDFVCIDQNGAVSCAGELTKGENEIIDFSSVESISGGNGKFEHACVIKDGVITCDGDSGARAAVTCGPGSHHQCRRQDATRPDGRLQPPSPNINNVKVTSKAGYFLQCIVDNLNAFFQSTI